MKELSLKEPNLLEKFEKNPQIVERVLQREKEDIPEEYLSCSFYLLKVMVSINNMESPNTFSWINKASVNAKNYREYLRSQLFPAMKKSRCAKWHFKKSFVSYFILHFKKMVKCIFWCDMIQMKFLTVINKYFFYYYLYRYHYKIILWVCALRMTGQAWLIYQVTYCCNIYCVARY